MNNLVPPTIRPAASLLLRDATTRHGGIEIVAIRRSDSMRFLPGYLAFPGGAVDKSDTDMAKVSSQDLRILSPYSQDDEVFAVAALRECYEEIGVQIANPTLRFVGRWVTPPNPRARFDTRFFAVDASLVGESFVINHGEVEWARWCNPVELCAAIEANQMQAVPPTRAMLSALVPLPDVTTAMRTLTVPGPTPQP